MGHVASGASSASSMPGGLLGVLAAISLGIARPLGISPQAVSSTLAYVGLSFVPRRRMELVEREMKASRNSTEGGGAFGLSEIFARFQNFRPPDQSKIAFAPLSGAHDTHRLHLKPHHSIFLVSGIALGFPAAARWLSGGEFFRAEKKKVFQDARERAKRCCASLASLFYNLEVNSLFSPSHHSSVFSFSYKKKKKKKQASTKSPPRSPSSSSPTPSARRCS